MKSLRTTYGERDGQCRLCHTETRLCRSHILPEFCYSDLYDEKGRAIITGADLNDARHVQKGIREFLLCGQCEQLFGRWERRFKAQWHDRLAVDQQDMDRGVKAFNDLDYEQLKLFLLSVFWRAGVSTAEGFEAVRLGPYQDELRARLLSGCAGPRDQFAVGARLVLDENDVVRQLVATPRRAKLRHLTVYYCMFSGAEWYLHVCRSLAQHSSRNLLDSCLHEDGTMACPVIPLQSSMAFGRAVRLEMQRKTRSRWG